MTISEIESLILEQKIIEKLFTSPKKIFNKGSFKSYKEFPLDWMDDLNIENFTGIEKSFSSYKKYIFIGMGGAISSAKIASFYFPKKIFYLDNFENERIKFIQKISKEQESAIIVCSKSGKTIETFILNSILGKKNHEDIYFISDDYDSRFDKKNTFITPKKIPGRFGICTYFGIIPFILGGVNVKNIIHQINLANKECRIISKNNPAIPKIAFLFSQFDQGLKILGINSEKNNYVKEWIEQLISESTGKNNSGLYPLMNVKKPFPYLNFSNDTNILNSDKLEVKLSGPENLFYQLHIWLYVITIFGSLLKIQPFDQPNVEQTKINTQNMLSSNEKNYSKYKVYSSDKISKIIRKKNPGKFKIINFCIFGLNKDVDFSSQFEILKHHLSKKNIFLSINVAPQYLHSTGQMLKGSEHQITNILINLHGNVDLNIPNSLYTLNTFVKTQAIADYLALKKKKRKVYFVETNLEELKNQFKILNNDTTF